jgi:hypothetical protein
MSIIGGCSEAFSAAAVRNENEQPGRSILSGCLDSPVLLNI